MPNLTLKETIELLKEHHLEFQTAISEELDKSLELAISKLSFLAQVENMGGVNKKNLRIIYECGEHPGECDITPGEGCYECQCAKISKREEMHPKDVIFNEALELCQADLVRRLEGIEKLIIKTISVDYGGFIEPGTDISELSQALITHLTTPERTQGEGA